MLCTNAPRSRNCVSSARALPILCGEVVTDEKGQRHVRYEQRVERHVQSSTAAEDHGVFLGADDTSSLAAMSTSMMRTTPRPPGPAASVRRRRRPEPSTPEG